MIDNTTAVPSFVGTDNVGHWDSYYGVDIDSDGNVLSWTSRQDKDGNNYKLMTIGNGPRLTEDETLLGNRPVIHWSSSDTGYFKNETYRGLAGKTAVYRVIVAKNDSKLIKIACGRSIDGYRC